MQKLNMKVLGTPATNVITKNNTTLKITENPSMKVSATYIVYPVQFGRGLSGKYYGSD